ncbi:MAG: AMP-binding protein, partial [Terriglobales bacterium]
MGSRNPMRATMMQFPLTLDAVLRRAATLFPNVALVEGETRTTYASFCERAARLARGLRAVGLQPGEPVATLLWNRMPHLEAYFAVPLAGGVVHPLNLRLHPAQLAQIVRHAGDRFILLEGGRSDLWREIAPHAGAVRVLHCPDDWNTLADTGGQAALPSLGEEDGAAMGYTSGTTGEPKGVVYSHRALILHALATALPDAMNLRASDCAMPLVPMFHANAWGIPYTAALMGCKQVLCGAQFGAEAALDLLAAEQVTFSAGVGAIWQAVLDAYEREPGRWKLHSGLRVNLGGAPAPPSLFRQFDRAGIAVNMGWGMTEMTPVGTMNPHCAPAPSESEHARRARQGRPLPLVEAR